MKKAIYPGTFDPITNGHINVIHRASNLFDSITVAVAKNSSKQTIFDEEKRVQLIKENFQKSGNIEVISFDGLIVDLAVKLGAVALIRGLRVASDFEYEFQMAQMNRHLDPELETIFLMPNEKYFFTSSQLIKQVHLYGAKETGLVPENVFHALQSLSGVRDT